MTNQIAERTIKSCYVNEVQNGHLDFISRFAIFVQERELYVSALCSFKNWATTNLHPNKLRQFASSCEWRMSLTVLVKVEDRNEKVRYSFHKRLMLQWLANVADCLKVRLHNQSSSKQRTGLIIASLAIINSNQTTRCSPPRGVDSWARDYPKGTNIISWPRPSSWI